MTISPARSAFCGSASCAELPLADCDALLSVLDWVPVLLASVWLETGGVVPWFAEVWLSAVVAVLVGFELMLPEAEASLDCVPAEAAAPEVPAAVAAALLSLACPAEALFWHPDEML